MQGAEGEHPRDSMKAAFSHPARLNVRSADLRKSGLSRYVA
jgi:hypothetical protein